MSQSALTTEELIYRVDGLAQCALRIVNNSGGEPFPPCGLTTLLETLTEAAEELGQRADQEKFRTAPAPGK